MVVLIRYWTQRRGHNAGLAVSVHRPPGKQRGTTAGWSILPVPSALVPGLSCCRLTTHHPTSLCPSFASSAASHPCLPPAIVAGPYDGHRLPSSRKPTGFWNDPTCWVWGNQRFPFGMDENIWEAKNGLNNPIPSSLPPHHQATHTATFWEEEDSKNTVEGTGSGRGENSRAGGGKVGRPGMKPGSLRLTLLP